MKVCQGGEVPFHRSLDWRGGTTEFAFMMAGPDGSLGNYSLTVGVFANDMYSPRHRHNFDQIRIQLDGAMDFGATGRMDTGMVAYFPEGVFYGPQTTPADAGRNVSLTLQFGGASKSGYISLPVIEQAVREMRELGEFKKGGYRSSGGSKALDAFQAIWEHVNGRPLVYPAPRYGKPIFFDPAHFDWIPSSSSAWRKPLGIFTECETGIELRRYDSGADIEIRANGSTLVFAMSGSGDLAGDELRPWTTVAAERGEVVRGTAKQDVELAVMMLPQLVL